MENHFMNTVSKAKFYIDMIDSPYLQIYPDSGNITNAAKTYSKDVVADLETGAGHIVAIHLKESLPGVFREIPFGTGHVDFESIITTGMDLGVRKFVTELWYVDNEDWFDRIIEAIAMTRVILNKK